MIGPSPIAFAKIVSDANKISVAAAGKPWVDCCGRHGAVLLNDLKTIPFFSHRRHAGEEQDTKAMERVTGKLAGIIRSFRTIWARTTADAAGADLSKPDHQYHPEHEIDHAWRASRHRNIRNAVRHSKWHGHLAPAHAHDVVYRRGQPTRERAGLPHHDLTFAAGTGGGLGEPHIA